MHKEDKEEEVENACFLFNFFSQLLCYLRLQDTVKSKEDFCLGLSEDNLNPFQAGFVSSK